MIQITRALARRFRAVLRKSVPQVRRGRLPLLVQTGNDGLCLCAGDAEVTVIYHQAGKLPVENVVLPSEALADFEGGKEEIVSLECNAAQSVQARWNDGGVPQVRDYPLGEKESTPDTPAMPPRWHRQEPSLLDAFREAVATAAKDGVRFALQRLQLRGARGEIVGTDGRQLLIQRGFSFPWKDDVLVPALGVFGCKEVVEKSPVALGRTDTHLGLRIGPWTFLLAIDTQGRFPRSEDVIPASHGSVTRVRLDEQDAAFLTRTLPRLPGESDENAPLTLDLNGHVAVRARAEGQERLTELVLSRSEVSGPPLRLVTNRLYLARVAALGFASIDVLKADVPIVCRDEQKLYMWMPLGKGGALAPSPDAVCIESSTQAPVARGPKQERREPTVNLLPDNGSGNGQVVPPRSKPLTTPAVVPSANIGAGFNGLIEEAQALRSLLRDALVRVNQLLIAAKTQKKQGQLLRQTLTTLKQLQNVPT